MADFYAEREVTARKPHTCCEPRCRRTKQIEPGTRYVRHVGTFDGFFSIASCVRCARLRSKAIKRYPPDYPDEGPVFGGLLEYLQEARRW